MLTGSLVAIVTPMEADGALDIPRFKALLDWHVAEGTDGIVVVGTTGESPTVDVDEHCLLIRTAVEHCEGTHSGHRGHGRQFHARGDRTHEVREGSRRELLALRGAVLQQARRRKGSTGTSRPSPRRWTSR